MSSTAAITGLGLITPLGRSADLSWRALLAGHFIDDHARVDIATQRDEPRVTALAHVAAREALAGAGWSSHHLCDDATALVVGTSKGPVERWLTAPPVLSDVERLIRPPIDASGLAEIADALATDLRLEFGARLTLSAACASGLHALIRGAMMIQAGHARRVLVVAAEASVHPLFIGSFQRLGVLPKPGIGCRPFDETRDGFLMSDAAAAVCLESSDALPSALRTYATIDRFGLGGDARHLTAGDPRAALLKRLLHAVVNDQPVDLIHAHGTGTPTNDPTELAAIESVVASDDQPSVYSHKGAIGHSLGAAGLVSIVLNCLSARDSVVPPNVRTRQPLPTKVVRIDREPVQRAIRRSIASAAGFGGPTAVVSLRH